MMLISDLSDFMIKSAFKVFFFISFILAVDITAHFDRGQAKGRGSIIFVLSKCPVSVIRSRPKSNKNITLSK